MTTSPSSDDDPAITGVPPETPPDVRPSATGLVTGPVDDEVDVTIADVDAGRGTSTGTEQDSGASMDQLLADAEGGIEGSTLDAPDD
jgi:hypothetical protein